MAQKGGYVRYQNRGKVNVDIDGNDIYSLGITSNSRAEFNVIVERINQLQEELESMRLDLQKGDRSGYND